MVPAECSTCFMTTFMADNSHRFVYIETIATDMEPRMTLKPTSISWEPMLMIKLCPNYFHLCFSASLHWSSGGREGETATPDKDNPTLWRSGTSVWGGGGWTIAPFVRDMDVTNCFNFDTFPVVKLEMLLNPSFNRYTINLLPARI